jgi:predicted Fe-Mo cluster-binding NifX family protein
LVSQGVSGVLCGGEISDNAKKILDNAGIWYEENVEPHELERAVEEGEGEW